MDGTSAYEIRPTPNKGLGMFATQSIERGERILCERPLLRIRILLPPLEKVDVRELYHTFSNLPAEEQRNYLQLHAPQIQIDRVAHEIGANVPEEIQERARELTAILRTNAIQLDSETGTDPSTCGVFRIASRINHSCCPNASYIWNERIGCLSVHAVKPISIDEEVTINYVSTLFDRHYRQQKLERYGFICACPACDEALAVTESGKASQIRRERLDRLDNDLSFFFKRSLKQQCILGPLSPTVVDSNGVEQPFQAVKKMAKLARQENLIMDRLPEWCAYL